MSAEQFTWEPPTAESLYRAYEATRDMIPPLPGEDTDLNNFPFLYDRQVAEDGTSYEVLPGLEGRVDNYYVRHTGQTAWGGSQVWINNGTFRQWYAALKK